MTKKLIVIVAMALFGAICYYIGVRSLKVETKIEYIDSPPIHIEKDTSNLRPFLERLTASVVYVTTRPEDAECVKIDPSEEEPQANTQPSPTELDWNIERTYKEVVLDSDTIGHATVTATVQYNTLTGLIFDYTPRQRVDTRVIKERKIRGYALTTITNSGAQAGAGIKFGSLGVHGVYGYDYRNKNNVVGAGILVFF